MKPITIKIAQDVPSEDLAAYVADSLSIDDLVEFVKQLETRCADWEFSRRVWEMAEQWRVEKIAEDGAENPAGSVANAAWGER